MLLTLLHWMLDVSLSWQMFHLVILVGTSKSSKAVGLFSLFWSCEVPSRLIVADTAWLMLQWVGRYPLLFTA